MIFGVAGRVLAILNFFSKSGPLSQEKGKFLKNEWIEETILTGENGKKTHYVAIIVGLRRPYVRLYFIIL